MASNSNRDRRTDRSSNTPRRDATAESGHKSRTGFFLILAGAVLAVVFAALNGLQLASIERAVGVSMPEARPAGYDAAYVDRIQAGMTDELYEQYGAAHYLWGILFPLVFAATLILLILRVAGRRKAKWLLLPIPVIYAVVDIAENILIDAMFTASTIDPGAVATASTLTVLKFILLVACLAAAIIALLIRPKRSARQTS